MKDIFIQIEENIHKGIVLFGAGNNGIWSLDYLQEQGYTVDCFIDNSPELQNTFIRNIPILSPSDFFKKNSQKVILVTPHLMPAQILQSLEHYALKMSFKAWFFFKNEKKYQENRL